MKSRIYIILFLGLFLGVLYNLRPREAKHLFEFVVQEDAKLNLYEKRHYFDEYDYFAVLNRGQKSDTLRWPDQGLSLKSVRVCQTNELFIFEYNNKQPFFFYEIKSGLLSETLGNTDRDYDVYYKEKQKCDFKTLYP